MIAYRSHREIIVHFFISVNCKAEQIKDVYKVAAVVNKVTYYRKNNLCIHLFTNISKKFYLGFKLNLMNHLELNQSESGSFNC